MSKKEQNNINQEDLNLWSKTLSSVTPLKKNSNLKVSKVAVTKMIFSRKEKNLRFKSSTILDKQMLSAENSVSKRELQLSKQSSADVKILAKLKRGKIQPQITLDLHGMSVNTAHQNVISFIKAAFQNNLRLILIVTGKGRLKNYESLFNEPGKLKNELPRWIDRSDLNRYVLNISLAHGIHGGEGAYYIYLKKNRSYRT